MRAFRLWTLASLLAAAVLLPLQAQEQQLPTFEPDAPAGQPQQSESAGAPEVTIRQEGDRRIEEYRLNGVLYAVKVTPGIGKPYFLVRSDGDNNFFHSEQPGMLIPAWKLFSW